MHTEYSSQFDSPTSPAAVQSPPLQPTGFGGGSGGVTRVQSPPAPAPAPADDIPDFDELTARFEGIVADFDWILIRTSSYWALRHAAGQPDL